MLRKLSFTNFKTWASVDLACGSVTGLFGTNSSGKTSILQFLLMLKQTREATDRALSLELNGPYVKLGTIYDAIHKHDETKRIDFTLEFEREKPLILDDPDGPRRGNVLAQGTTVTLSSQIGIHLQAPRAQRLAYRLGDLEFSLTQTAKKGNPFELAPRKGEGFGFVRTKGRGWPLPGPIKGYAFPDQARTYFQNAGFLSELETAYEAAIDRVYYLGPLREYPQRDYMWARSRPTDVGQRGENAIDAILAASDTKETRRLTTRRSLGFQEMVAHWLRAMGLIHDFKVEEIAPGSNRWQAKVVTRPGGQQVLLTDVGFGVSQVLPVITLLLFVPEGSTVILEQPEIHLHPLAQAGLADVIVHVAKLRKVQVIVESHSEHLLLRLQRRIAEQTLPANDVKLYFCDASTGESKLTPLELDLFGRVTNWPDKFMGDAFGETAKAELARLHFMQAAAE